MNLMQKGPLGLKQPRVKNGTAAGLEHMRRVKMLPCVVCGSSPPNDAHHVFCGRFSQRRASDFDTVSLCKNHHQGPEGIHTSKRRWVERHGNDYDYLPVVADMLAGEWNSPWRGRG